MHRKRKIMNNNFFISKILTPKYIYNNFNFIASVIKTRFLIIIPIEKLSLNYPLLRKIHPVFVSSVANLMM